MRKLDWKTNKNNKGITLTALVITIIVLLILATISIVVFTGENGIIARANKAKEEEKKAEYKEELTIIGLGLQPDRKLEEWDNQEYMNLYEEKIKKDSMFEEAKEVRQLPNKEKITIQVITKEGWVYWIIEGIVKYEGSLGENIPPDLNIEESNIEFKAKPSEWTNTEVEVEIITTIEGYQLQYSIDGENWNNYEATVMMKDNGAIYARLMNDFGETGGYATGNIKNIDRLAPHQFTPTATSTTNSITLTGTTTDTEETQTDGESKVAKYYFSKDNGASWEPIVRKEGTNTYTFYELQQNTTYHLRMKAVDHAGNETVTEEITTITEEVPSLTASNTTFHYTPTTWTRGDVTVTITTTAGYSLQYSTDGNTWTDYTTAITMRNNGEIYARAVDSTGQAGGYATGNIRNIDKLPPNQFTPRISSTTNSITLTGSTTDASQTNTNGSSGVAKYYFSKNNGSTFEPASGQTGTSYTFSGLAQNTTYSFKMKAVDNAGNEIVTNTITGRTGSVPNLSTSNTTFTYSPTTWTKGNVSVTIKTTAGSGYTLQYSTNGSTWANYSSAITMTNNGAIYARVKDSTGQVGGYATGNVSNIDRTPPSVTVSVGSVTQNSAKLTVSASDSQSGIANYKYYLGSTLKATTTTNNYTFTGLSIASTYTLKVVVTDKAGNTTEKSGTATTTLPSTSNTKPFLPPGATVTNPNIETGLSIKDSKGNEWVWIEVPKSIYPSGTSSTNYTAIENAMKTYSKDYGQSGYTDTFYSTAQHGFANATEYNNHKNAMLKSVFENGGFYIGKYETGTTTPRFSASNTLTTPVIKRDVYPYTWITCRQAQTKAKELTTGGRTSSLMFGIQWNLTLKFIEVKSGKKQAELKVSAAGWGNYKDASFDVTRGLYTTTPTTSGSWKGASAASKYTKPVSKGTLLTTGASDRNSVLGIYDLAGNVTEWTLEKSPINSTPCPIHGGVYYGNGSDSPMHLRGYTNTTYASYDSGFRAALW